MSEGAALAIDGFIIIFYFVGILLIGVYVGRREDSLEDYALGGRKIPWWAVMASIIAAETSAATFLGAPAEGFKVRGLMYVQLVMGLIIGRVLVGYIFLKPYYLYRVYTVYDFLLVRFGATSKYTVSGMFLFMRAVAMGVRLFVPSLVMVLAWRLFVQREDVTFEQVEHLAPYAWAIIILTVLTCIYTALGGIKAVIWTDLIQATLMFTSALVAIVTLLYHIGGDSWNLLNGFRALAQSVPEMTQLLPAAPGAEIQSGYLRTGLESAAPGMTLWEIVRVLLANPYTLPAALIGATVGNMAAFGTDQDMVQRMLTAETYRKARRSLISAALMDVPIASAFTFIGVLLIVFYEQRPELMPPKTNDVFGQYILSVMPVVVRGFVLAGVFATAMGSLSAALNALATAATNDWFIPLFAPNAKGHTQVAIARFFTAFFAGLMIAIAIGIAYINISETEITILPIALGAAGIFLGPMLGVFLLGMLTKRRGNDLGNVLAIIAGMAGVLVLSGQHLLLADVFVTPDEGMRWVLPEWLRNPASDDPRTPWLSFTWYQLVGGSITLFVGALFPTPHHVVEDAARRRAEGVLHETQRTGLQH